MTVQQNPLRGENSASHVGANHTRGRASISSRASTELQPSDTGARPTPFAGITEPPADMLTREGASNAQDARTEPLSAAGDGAATSIDPFADMDGFSRAVPLSDSEDNGGIGDSERRESALSDSGGGTGGAMPAVIHVNAETARMEDEALDVLATIPGVYQRDHVGLARITTTPILPDDMTERDKQRRPPPGIPSIVAAPAGLLASWLSRHVEWSGYDARMKQEKRVRVPSDVVSGLLARRGEELRNVPVLRGIVEAPFMRRDGTLCTSHGYDPRTGLFLQWNGAPLSIADRPTHDDARRAAEELAFPFCEFKYQGAAHHAIAGTIAAMMTPLARHAIRGPVPAFGWEANAPTAGKTLTANACSIVVTGRESPVRRYTSDDDEMEKRMGAIAIEGCPLVLLDDVTEHVSGGCVQALLTAENSYAFRLLGYSENKTIAWRTTMFWTFNNVSVSEDMAERFVLMRLFSRGRIVPGEEPGTQSRTFAVPDLLGYMREHRDRMLTNLLTILRAHTLAGRPRTGNGREKYPAWTEIVSSAVAWAMRDAGTVQGVALKGGDPSEAKPAKGANRDEDIAERIVFGYLSAFGSDCAMTVGQIIDAVRDADESKPGAKGPMHTQALVSLRQALEELTGKDDLAKAKVSAGKSFEHRVMNRTFARDGGGSVYLTDAGKLHNSRLIKAVIRGAR